MDTYYQLLEQDTSKVSSVWKGIHLTSLIVGIISGFITAYTLGKAVAAFGDNCVLYPFIEFEDENTTDSFNNYQFLPLPDNLTCFDSQRTQWGSLTQCYFCQFTPVMATIFGISWLVIFIVCAKGGAGYLSDTVYRPWRVVYPAMAFAAISTIVLLISTLQLSTGVSKFCGEFEIIFGTEKCTSQIDLYTYAFHTSKRPLYLFLTFSVVCSYICFASWLTQLISLVMRVLCVVDFQMIRITVITKDEKVSNVIGPDEENRNENVSISSETEDKLSKPKESSPSIRKTVSWKNGSSLSKDQSHSSEIDSSSLQDESVPLRDDVTLSKNEQSTSGDDSSTSSKDNSKASTSPQLKKEKFPFSFIRRGYDSKTDAKPIINDLKRPYSANAQQNIPLRTIHTKSLEKEDDPKTSEQSED